MVDGGIVLRIDLHGPAVVLVEHAGGHRGGESAVLHGLGLRHTVAVDFRRAVGGAVDETGCVNRCVGLGLEHDLLAVGTACSRQDGGCGVLLSLGTIHGAQFGVGVHGERQLRVGADHCAVGCPVREGLAAHCGCGDADRLVVTVGAGEVGLPLAVGIDRELCLRSHDGAHVELLCLLLLYGLTLRSLAGGYGRLAVEIVGEVHLSGIGLSGLRCRLIRMVNRCGDGRCIDEVGSSVRLLVAHVGDAVDPVGAVVLLGEFPQRQCSYRTGLSAGLGIGLPVDGGILLHVDGLLGVHQSGQSVGLYLIEHAVLAACPVLLGRREVGRLDLSAHGARSCQHTNGQGCGLAVQRVGALLLLIVGDAVVVAHADTAFDEGVAVGQLIVHLVEHVGQRAVLTTDPGVVVVRAGADFDDGCRDAVDVDGAGLRVARNAEAHIIVSSQVVPRLSVVGTVLPLLELQVAPVVGSVDEHLVALLSFLGVCVC